MWFLQLVTFFALLGFILGLFEAFVEGMKNPPHWLAPFTRDPTPHWFTFLCGFWLLIAAILELSNAIKNKTKDSD
jgi:hypothetical protein